MNPSTLTTASFADLWQAVLASGLLAQEDQAKLLAAANGDAAKLAMALSEAGFTRFQLAALSEGRGAALRVGNYDLLDRLGAGGMGTVFKARHRRMKRIVALKVLSASLSSNPIFVKRFQREVETIASLGHPNIVMAYDADEAEVGHFLVMEFINGQDLAACVERRGALPVAQAVDFLLQTARGLSYAHSQGIVHRDIKPHNLLLDEANTVKITDLGLARLNHGAAGPAMGADVTMAGGAIGTADYMPPEQAIDATTIDHRADIYSLGCTLYFLLTGSSPYSGSSLMAILLAHRDAAIPSLRTAIPQIPARLDALFQKMLTKNVEQRIATMAEVVAELEAIAATIPREVSNRLDQSRTVVVPAGVVKSAASTIASSTAVTSDGTVEFTTGDLSVTAVSTSVLVVEPSRVQAAFIKNYLAEQALEVVGSAANGSAAMDEVRKLRPRAVVSAMHLPDMTGLDLAQRIRTEMPSSAPGFILVTSEAADQAILPAELRRVQVLPKPFTAEQLAAAVAQVTGGTTSITSADAPGLTPKVDRQHARVLIVDDSGTARINVRNVLQGLGFTQFVEVADGAQAVAVAARESCDLIVTDYNMPLMDGRALVSYLRQNPATATVPIVMFTTETDPKILDPVRRLGVLAIVEKAFPASVVGPLLAPLF